MPQGKLKDDTKIIATYVSEDLKEWTTKHSKKLGFKSNSEYIRAYLIDERKRDPNP